MLAALTLSCGGPATQDAKLAVNCRPPPKPSPVAAEVRPPWTTRTFPVLVRGMYVPAMAGDAAVNPTVIELAGIGLAPGDYIGLSAKGGWYAWNGDPNAYHRLGGVFRDKKGSRLKPGDFGQDVPFQFWGNPAGSFGDIPEDFDIPESQDRQTVVRIPKGATQIAFSVGDWWVGDNCPPEVTGYGAYKCGDAKFEVEVTEPNRPNVEAASGPEAIATDEPDIATLGVKPSDFRSYPEAKSFSASPFATASSSATDGQWRGNYPPRGAWLPNRSKYDQPRPTTTDPKRRHWGWDIFAPYNSKLVAPVWPAELRYTTGNGFGNVAVLAFTWKKKPYWLIYAHLNGPVGANRTITGPEVIAMAGCTQNSDGGCGMPLRNGTRTDHVHVGLLQVPNQNGNVADSNACDPAAVLPWKLS
jgi:hypothetical protein